MAYGVGHLSSSSRAKCVICNKVVSNYVEIANYQKNGEKKIGTSIVIPVCDGDCRKKVVDKSEILISYANQINKLART